MPDEEALAKDAEVKLAQAEQSMINEEQRDDNIVDFAEQNPVSSSDKIPEGSVAEESASALFSAEEILKEKESSVSHLGTFTSSGNLAEKISQLDDIPTIKGDISEPDQLPDKMVYDSFELNRANADIEPESLVANNMEVESVINENTQSQFGGQNIVKRTQLASIHQYLGPNYDLTILDLDQNSKTKLIRLCQSFLRNRMWLENELSKNDFDIDGIKNSEKIQNVPEILAVEIYLRCYELGGRCVFKQQN